MARPEKEKQYIIEKRDELVWAMSHQDWSNADIARIFNIDPSRVTRIIAVMPKGWKPKWVKVQ